jgi:hypothetical protein
MEKARSVGRELFSECIGRLEAIVQTNAREAEIGTR